MAALPMAARSRVLRGPRRSTRAVGRQRKESPEQQYRRGRAAAGLLGLIMLVGGLWLLNGSFTAAFVQRLGGTVELGWGVHLLFAAIELAAVFARPYLSGMPRLAIVVIIGLTLPFGVADVFSSALGLLPLFGRFVTGDWLHLISTLAAEALAFAPEPLLLWLIIALHKVYRG